MSEIDQMLADKKLTPIPIVILNGMPPFLLLNARGIPTKASTGHIKGKAILIFRSTSNCVASYPSSLIFIIFS